MSKKTELDLLMEKASEEEISMRLMRVEIIIMSLATQDYNGPLGIKPYGIKADMEKVEKSFSHPEILKYLLNRVFLMDRICGKYDLEFPTDSRKTEKKQLREWFEGVIEKRWSANDTSDILERHDYLCDFMNRHVAKYMKEERRKNEKQKRRGEK